MIDAQLPRVEWSRRPETLDPFRDTPASVREVRRLGRLRADPQELWLDVDRLRSSRSPKGEACKIVAVIDVRRRVRDLDRYLADARWRGGEGL